jgi:integrase
MRGSIRQRGTTFTAYWEVVDPGTGKRVQHTKGGFRTQGAAQKHLNAVMPKVDSGEWKPDQPLTVKQLLTEHWLPAQKSRELRPSTLEQYRIVIDAWIVPKIGAVRASALTPKVVNEMVTALRTTKSSTGRKGLSARSAQLSVGVLKSACAWAVVNGLLGRNPVAGIQRPRSQSTVMKAWDTDQARAFLASTTTDRLSFAWSLLLTRGLRRGEACGLRWQDIDLGAGVVRINRTRVTVDGKPIDSSPKTEAGRRAIHVDPSLVALLKAHKARQAAEKLAAGAAYEDDGYLLADELGAPYHPETVSGWFDDAVKAAKLPRIRLHDTRHTAASLMLAAGVPVKVVSEMLGHSSPTITLAIYAHVMPGMAEEAGAALSASLLGP